MCLRFGMLYLGFNMPSINTSIWKICITSCIYIYIYSLHMTEIDSIEKHESPEHQVNEIWFLKQTAVLRFWLAINISVFDFVAIKPEQEVYITTLSHLHFFIR